MPLPLSVESGRCPLDVNPLCHAPPKPVGFLVLDRDTLFVNRMSPVVHMVTDRRGRALTVNAIKVFGSRLSLNILCLESKLGIIR